MITYPLNNIDYTAEDAELYFSTRESGVHDGEDFEITITGIDNDVTIGTGIAWIHNTKFSGKVAALKTPKTLGLDLADSVYDRIDAIVIQFDARKNVSDVIVKKGTASSAPVAPSVSRTESLYELHIYHIRRKAGATTIGVDDIIDQRKNPDCCGIMFDPISSVDETLSKRGFAADAEAVGKAINSIGGVSMTLLWENASPASEFAAQTIALDLSGYDSVQVEFEESWQTITSRINVGKYGGVDQIGDIYRDVAAYFYVAHRDISVTTTGVSFSDRLYKYANEQWSRTDNNGLIPFRIYGIKMGGGSSAGVLPAAEGVGF